MSEQNFLTLNDNIDAVITTSNFYLDNSRVGGPALFKPGDRFFIDLSNPKEPKLTVTDRVDCGNSITFTPKGDAVIADRLTIDTQFLAFRAEYEGAQWRVEVLRQRRPPMLHCSPGNEDVAVQFFFWALTDANGKPLRNTGHTKGFDGSGGGVQRA